MLPLEIRNDLNARLSEGDPAHLVIEWLNTHPSVLAVLNTHFDGQKLSHPSEAPAPAFPVSALALPVSRDFAPVRNQPAILSGPLFPSPTSSLAQMVNASLSRASHFSDLV